MQRMLKTVQYWFVVFLVGVLSKTLASQAEPRFEVAVVKHFNTQALAYRGCYVGPGLLQYNCGGPVPLLMAQALELEYFSHVYTNNEPTYSIIAKVSKPQPSQQLHAMLLRLLMEGMGVRYHIEKRPIQAWFINVVSLDLLKKLPVSNDPLPISFAFPVPRFPPVIIPQSWEFVRRGIPVQGVSEVTARNVTFRLFAEALRADCRCLVIDETGLPQRFNFDKFTTRMYDSEATSAESLEDVTKLLKDYGISLKARKGVVDFLVIDKVADEKKFLN